MSSDRPDSAGSGKAARSGGKPASRTTKSGGYRGGSSGGGSRSGGKPKASGGSSGGGSRSSSSRSSSHGTGSGDGRTRQSQRPEENESRSAGEFDEELIELARTQRVLTGDVREELEAFHPRVADLVGAAYLLVEENPEEALRYCLTAKKHASRSPAVREACGMSAYHAGDFATAIKELRTVRRLSGRDDVVPLIADCERALGNPQKALDLAMEPLRLSAENQVELRIVAAGARLDLGQPEAAGLLLRTPLLEAETQSTSSARLKYAYAETLVANGDTEQAKHWFTRAAAADVEGDTDAEDRLVELQQL